MVIISFNKDYRFLSNFYSCKIRYNNIDFNSVEVAYQASKCKNSIDIEKFKNLTSADAKLIGRNIELRDDWENVKNSIMKELLLIKFKDYDLLQKLLNTYDSYLIEGNYWHDNYWGVCYCKECKGIGKNMLGSLLMEVRSENTI